MIQALQSQPGPDKTHEGWNKLDAELVLPCQIKCGEALPSDPERRLVMAVLLEAVNDVLRTTFSQSEVSRRNSEDALRWIASNKNDHLLSFESVCDLLDIDPSALRKRLVELVEMEEASMNANASPDLPSRIASVTREPSRLPRRRMWFPVDQRQAS